MAKETKIGMKLEEKTKGIKKMCEQLGDSIKHEFDKGVEHIDTDEMKEAIDMLKDLYEIKKSMVEACYYKQIMEAMEESEYGEDYDQYGPMEEERMYYRGQPRDSMGRFTSRGGRRGRSSRGGRRRMGYEEMIPMDYEDPITWERDMDMSMGRMYYNGQGGSSGSSNEGRSSGGSSSRGGSDGRSSGSNNSSRYGFAFDNYMQERRNFPAGEPEGKKKRMEMLDSYMDDLWSMSKEMIADMTPEEKQQWKLKLNKMINM